MNGTEQSAQTRRLLIRQYQRYPNLEIQDILKFLHQSAFGCEHLISSADMAIASIIREREALFNQADVAIEPLDGTYSRVPLTVDLSAQTLGKLLVASAKSEENGTAVLRQKLTVVRDLIAEGALPFCLTDFECAVAQWETTGFSAFHHSDSFRKTYHPSYRVIANDYIPFLPFFAQLDKRLAQGAVIVAIEGGSASGKTTLGRLLSHIYDATVFHMDDFFLQPVQRTAARYAEAGGNVDWERFLAEVLKPLSRQETIYYRPFDCQTMQIGVAVPVTPARLTVVEGAYSMHPELASYYDVSLFLDVSPEQQCARIQKRNSPALAQRFFEEWIPLENDYFRKTDVQKRCSMTVRVS